MQMTSKFWINLILISSVAFSTSGQINSLDIYVTVDNDSVLTTAFVKKLCRATREHIRLDNGQMEVEKLILEAVGIKLGDTLQSQKSFKWHQRFGNQCHCEKNKHFPEGNFLRQMVWSNYRQFANIIGSHNRLPLDLNLKDSQDGRTIYEFINSLRLELEAKHDDRRFEFQQDEEWRNVMFFYFLFSEYSIK